MAVYDEIKKMEYMRMLIERTSEERTYSKNVRSDFMSILTNVGGAMTYEQAKYIIRCIDERSRVIKNYNPEKYFMQEKRCDRLATDIDSNIVCLGPTVSSVRYNPVILWGLGYVINCCATPDDFLSIMVSESGVNSITYTADRRYCQLLFANHANTADVVRSIAMNDAMLAKTAGNIEELRPLYVIFVTETSGDAIDLTLERLGDLDLKVKHKVVTVSGGWRDLKCDYTEYEMSEDGE